MTINGLSKWIVDITNEIKDKSIEKVVKEYKDYTVEVIDTYYTKTGIKPTNYRGSIPNRSGLIKTGKLKSSIFHQVNKYNDTGYIYGIEYAIPLTRIKQGKYDFIKKVLDDKGSKYVIN